LRNAAREVLRRAAQIEPPASQFPPFAAANPLEHLPTQRRPRSIWPVGTTADFFISYTGKDKAWAVWIAWTLKAAG
jgi:hypothetical protein